MGEHVKIEGQENLVRDMNSQAIINKDGNALKNALAMRAKRKQATQDIEGLKKDVAGLKDTMNEILNLLKGNK